MVSGEVIGSTLLTSTTIDINSIAPDSFSPVTISYQATSSDASLGKLISVRFERVGGSQMDLDDVRMSGIVPEPASLGVIGIGVLALLKRRRSRRC